MHLLDLGKKDVRKLSALLQQLPCCIESGVATKTAWLDGAQFEVEIGIELTSRSIVFVSNLKFGPQDIELRLSKPDVKVLRLAATPQSSREWSFIPTTMIMSEPFAFPANPEIQIVIAA